MKTFLLLCSILLMVMNVAHPQILGKVLLGHAPEVDDAQGSISRLMGKSELSRSKRWDYVAEGCHCNGFSVTCLLDSHCIRRHGERGWYCKLQCCGTICIKGSRFN